MRKKRKLARLIKERRKLKKNKVSDGEGEVGPLSEKTQKVVEKRIIPDTKELVEKYSKLADSAQELLDKLKSGEKIKVEAFGQIIYISIP